MTNWAEAVAQASGGAPAAAQPMSTNWAQAVQAASTYVPAHPIAHSLAVGRAATTEQGFLHGIEGLGLGAMQGIAHAAKYVGMAGGKTAAKYWDRIVNEADQNYKAETAKHPGYALVGDVAGGVAPWLVGGGEVADAPSVLGEAWRGLKTGAVIGGLQPVPGNHYGATKSAQIAAAAGGGGIGGLILPPIAKAIGNGVSSVWDRLTAKEAPAIPAELIPQVAGAPQTAQAVQEALAAGRVVNPEAIARQAEAEKLGIRLTPGQATGDPTIISEEMNRRAVTPGMVDHLNAQNRLLGQNLHGLVEATAPEGVATDQDALGQHLIGAIQTRLAQHDAATSQAYKAVQDAMGSTPIVNGPQFGANAKAALAQDLHGDFLNPKVAQLVDDFQTGKRPMTLKNFETLRTILAREARGPDGTVAHAAGVVRDVLEGMPAEGQAGETKALADHARALARQGFLLREQIPAVRAVDADVGAAGKADSGKFVRKFLVNANPADVQNLRDFLSDDPNDLAAMQTGLLAHLRDVSIPDQAGLPGDVGKFRQASYNKALGLLKPKIDLLMPPEQAQTLQRIGDVGKYLMDQPAGTYVNNSNTAVAALAHAGTRGIASAVDAATGLPVGSLAHEAGTRIADKVMARARLASLLAPGAGISAKVVSASPVASRLGAVGLGTLLAQMPTQGATQ